MATKSATPISAFAYGTDPESLEANDRWQQAYDQLLQAVEKRQEKPQFDPFWLRIAEAGAAPTRTGSFFETMGNTAGAIGKFQQEEQAKAEDLAQKRLELAGMGLQQANQRSALREYQAASQPAPQGAPQPGQQASPSSGLLSTMGIEGQGVQMFPPQPLIPERQWVAGKVATGMNPIEAKMSYQDYLAKDIQIAQNGMVIQRSTGMGFDMPDPTPMEVPFLSLQGEPFKTTKTLARKLDLLTAAGDNQGRLALENKIRGIPQQAAAAPAPQLVSPPAPPAPPAAPLPAQPQAQPPSQVMPQTGTVPSPAIKPITTTSLPPPPAPIAPVAAATPPAAPPAALPPAVGMQPQSVRDRLAAEEKKRRDIEQALAIEEGKAKIEATTGVTTARAKKQDEADVAEDARIKKENRDDERDTIVGIKKAGRNQVNIADQYAKLITQYPNAIGTAANPGFLSAGIKLLESGASLGNETAKASALQEAVATLRGTPEELSARRVMMGLAAEYLFNLRSLAKGQGAITDYETQILSRIGPGIEDDAKTARFKASIIKMHGEAEIARANEYNEWKKSNQGMGWKDYLGSKEHDKFAAKYDQDLAKAYDIYLGKKPQARAQPAPQSSNPAMDFARSLR